MIKNKKKKKKKKKKIKKKNSDFNEISEKKILSIDFRGLHHKN